MTVWLTGLSSSGKSTIGRAVQSRLVTQEHRVELLDGDEVRQMLWPELGFSKADRDENVRRLGRLAHMLSGNGVIVIVCAISPWRAVRDEVLAGLDSVVEVYVNAPLATCEARDVKGLYRKARTGSLAGLTGVDDLYEPPLCPAAECLTDRETIEESANKVLAVIAARQQASEFTPASRNSDRVR